jgi:hypothetical protein
MKTENFQDPRGEYIRVCPYCHETFIALHMNRFYCPEKNGIKDFCKARFKRLVKELKEVGIEIERPKRPPLKLLFEPSEKNFRNIDKAIKETLLDRKIKILENVLRESDAEVISWKELQKLGFTLDEYDEITENEYGTKSPLYKNIQLVWLEENKVEIRKLKN